MSKEMIEQTKAVVHAQIPMRHSGDRLMKLAKARRESATAQRHFPCNHGCC